MFNDYQYEASKTFKPTKTLTPEQVRLLDWATGLGGEAGEVLDVIKCPNKQRSFFNLINFF